eukprot:4103120-Prymnesium_polylepis.1
MRTWHTSGMREAITSEAALHGRRSAPLRPGPDRDGLWDGRERDERRPSIELATPDLWVWRRHAPAHRMPVRLCLWSHIRVASGSALSDVNMRWCTSIDLSDSLCEQTIARCSGLVCGVSRHAAPARAARRPR